MHQHALGGLALAGINTRLIQQQLAEVPRLAESIQQGTVTASLILRKLGSYPRQNSLATGSAKFGTAPSRARVIEPRK